MLRPMPLSAVISLSYFRVCGAPDEIKTTHAGLDKYNRRKSSDIVCTTSFRLRE